MIILATLHLEFLEIFYIFKSEIPKNAKFEASKIVQIAVYPWNKPKLISRKMRVAKKISTPCNFTKLSVKSNANQVALFNLTNFCLIFPSKLMDFQSIWRNFWKISLSTLFCYNLTNFFFLLSFLSGAKVLCSKPWDNRAHVSILYCQIRQYWQNVPWKYVLLVHLGLKIRPFLSIFAYKQSFLT